MSSATGAKKSRLLNKGLPSDAKSKDLSMKSPYTSYGYGCSYSSSSSSSTSSDYASASQLAPVGATFANVNAAATSVMLGTAQTVPTGAATTVTGWSADSSVPPLVIGQIQSDDETYIVPYSMTYIVGAQISFSTAEDNNSGYRKVEIVASRTVGSTTSTWVIASATAQPPSDTSIPAHVQTSTVAQLISGDKLIVRVTHTGGETLTLATGISTSFYVMPRDKPAGAGPSAMSGN